MFYESFYKTCQTQHTELKLVKLMVHSKFHKICKFENHVTRNNAIITSLPKTMETMGKCGPPRNQTSYISFEKYFCQIVAFFTMPAHQIWSCHVTQEANFEKFLFCPNSAFNIREIHKISSKKLSTSEVISQKPHGGFHPPP